MRCSLRWRLLLRTPVSWQLIMFGAHQRSEQTHCNHIQFVLSDIFKHMPDYTMSEPRIQSDKNVATSIIWLKSVRLFWFYDYWFGRVRDGARGMAPGSVNAAGTCSFRQTTACTKRLCGRDSDRSVAWDDVFAIVLPLHSVDVSVGYITVRCSDPVLIMQGTRVCFMKQISTRKCYFKTLRHFFLI
jgi:hypothetical protein